MKFPFSPSAALAKVFGSSNQMPIEFTKDEVKAAEKLSAADAYQFNAMPQGVSDMMAIPGCRARSRSQIYNKWQEMESNPFVSSALTLQATAALGGHESTGEVVFIEQNPAYADDKQLAAIAKDVIDTLTPIFNEIAFPLTYTASAFGDAYGRLYGVQGEGIRDVYVEELVRPPLIQPFESGSKTVGYIATTGSRDFERLSIAEMTRMKMPRLQWVPQDGLLQKSMTRFIKSEYGQLPFVPSVAGGSFLYNAESAYSNLVGALAGIVGQRWLDSIDETILQVDLEGMSESQQEQYVGAITTMFKDSQALSKKVVESNTPFLQRITHLIPGWGNKGMEAITKADIKGGRGGDISIEDVMLHARSLSGQLGTDLSMIGFADQLAGGLGEGGFFRTSAQSAERSRVQRMALSKALNHIADMHVYLKSGGRVAFAPHQRPWEITFYSTVSALEKERTDTQMSRANAGLLILQALQQLKDMGATQKGQIAFLKDELMLDEDSAQVYVDMLANGHTESDESGIEPGVIV